MAEGVIVILIDGVDVANWLVRWRVKLGLGLFPKLPHPSTSIPTLYNARTFGDYGRLSAPERLQYVYAEIQRGGSARFDGVLRDVLAGGEEAQEIKQIADIRDVTALPRFLAHPHELVRLAASLRLWYLSMGLRTRMIKVIGSKVRILSGILGIDRRARMSYTAADKKQAKRLLIRRADLHCMLREAGADIMVEYALAAAKERLKSYWRS